MGARMRPATPGVGADTRHGLPQKHRKRTQDERKNAGKINGARNQDRRTACKKSGVYAR